MGILSSSFAKTAHSDGWAHLGRGPKLRQIFGAYGGQDCWAVQRRHRQIDDGNSYIGYDEFQKLVGAEEFSLLFVWDLFSQQNELMDVTELLTLICLFSSASLEEKARFLLALFDKSKCSVCTGVEVAQLCTMVLGILSRCTGLGATRMKEVSSSLKLELPSLLKAYAEAAGVVGGDVCFRQERVIFHSEVKHIIEPFKHSYERLAFSRPPPGDSPPPPPPNWGIIVGAPQRAAAPPGPNEQSAGAPRKPDAEPPQKKEPHLAWLSRLEDEPLGVVDSAPEPQRSWLLMHGVDFASVAKDLPNFRQTFVRSASTSLGLPAARVEVANIALGVHPASTLLELLLHPDIAGQDDRPLLTLVHMLEQQLGCGHSALRKGPFGAFIEDAELLGGPPRRNISSPLLSRGLDEQVERCEMAVQTDDDTELLRAPWPMSRPRVTDLAEVEANTNLRKAFRDLDGIRRRTEKAKVGRQSVLEELEKRKALIAELQAELGA